MTTEQKAKAYDEAVNKLRRFMTQGVDPLITRADVQDFFPELTESEDEKIRKSIHIYLDWLDGRKDYAPKGEYTIRDMIAWLEKQGEQKEKIVEFKASDGYVSKVDGKIHNTKFIEKQDGIDNCPLECSTNTVMTDSKKNQVEPKFKAGDWVVSNICNSSDLLHIIDKDDKNYEVETPQGNTGVPSIAYIDNNFHLWTIQDAKDGDVLAAYECYVIFKEIDGLNIKCYCTYHYMNNPSFHVDTLQNKDAFHPATKEQRDLLFQKMKESGYEWNAENKEVKKISQRIISAEAKEALYDKPAWSEEDEDYINDLIKYFSQNERLKNIKEDIVIWLKSLKDCVQPQPKVEWSEEDEHNIQNIDSVLFYDKTLPEDTCVKLRDFLKSLKQRIGG